MSIETELESIRMTLQRIEQQRIDGEELQRYQYRELREQLKSIVWMLNLCGAAALVYVGLVIRREFFG